ncbi:MAG: DUF4846 domain-containing protein [Thermoflexibacter sp.]
MKNIICFTIFALFFSLSLAQDHYIAQEGKTVQERILLPTGFRRIKVEENSFGAYLRNLRLKPHGSKVKFFDRSIKNKEGVYCAVIDMEIGTKDLQQCADAIIRLRAEYLFSNKQFSKIHFNFTNGDRADYIKYAEGYRAVIKGNKVSWAKSAQKDTSYTNFRRYLDLVFTYAGTWSLDKEMQAVKDISQLQIGDVFIKGGSPGHAVIVLDIAENPQTKEKIFLLAQSYMPAQDIQVLINPNDAKLSPWYSLNFTNELVTPEWTFEKKYLKRFVD